VVSPPPAGGDGEAPVLVSTESGVGWVRLNRPRARNAISTSMRGLLSEAFAQLDADDDVRVAVITGVGEAFCAGVDLKETSAAPQGHPLTSPVQPVSAPLERFRKPLVAAINGAAIGGGMELALVADMRIASTTARFALPEVRIGSLPGSGGTQRLMHAVSPALAGEMILTGEPIEGERALSAGLVSALTAPEELMGAASALALKVAANAPLSLRAAKLALRAAGEHALVTGLALERALWGTLAASEDRQEGRTAFRERRPARFLGR